MRTSFTQTRRNASRAVQNEYARLASKYDRKWSSYIQTTAGQICRRLSLSPGQTLLDIGCGTGVLLQVLRQAHPRVVLMGIDLTPQMLQIASRRLGPGVPLYVAEAQRLPFDDNSLDHVVSASVFHYLAHPEKTLEEIKRVLKPGGDFVMTDWSARGGLMKIYDHLLRRCHASHVKTWSQQAYADWLYHAGWTAIQIDQYRLNWFWHMMTVSAQNP